MSEEKTQRILIVGTPSASRLAFHALATQALAAASIPVAVVDLDEQAVQDMVDLEAAFRAQRLEEIAYPHYASSGRKRAQWKNETDKRGRSR